MKRALVMAAALGVLALAACDKGGGRAPCPQGKLCLERGNSAELETIDPARASLINEDHVSAVVGLSDTDSVLWSGPSMQAARLPFVWANRPVPCVSLAPGMCLRAQPEATVDRRMGSSSQ